MLPASLNADYLKQLELLKLRSRRTYLGHRQGGHLSLKRGHGLEFADFRKYELGDHPRYIDWGVYARSDKLFVKRFQEEQDLSVLILVDASASMFTPVEDEKWDRARDIALSLAYIALMQQDNVSVAALGSFISPRYYGAKGIHDLSSRFDKVEAVKSIDFAREVINAAAQVRFPGVAILISDFLMPFDVIRKSFNVLRGKNLDITAIQVLSPNDISPLPSLENAVVIDSETDEEIAISFTPEVREAYTERLLEHNAELQEYLRENKVSYALSVLNHDLEDFMLKNLPATGLVT